MSGNEFNGPIPSSLSNISGIEYLYLSRNDFRGSIPSLGKMTDLLELNLANNDLISTTDLIGRFFDSLTNCTHLEVFSLTTNRLAGQLPTSNGNLSTHLQDFSVDDNLFSGSFPRGVHNYRNLTILDLQQNSFTGSVPKSIGLLRKLQKFSLQENSFAGEIPDIFSNLTQLYRLNLSDNQFYGRIPLSIGDCQHLELLDISGNKLTGNIPKELFNLPDLTFNLSLARNFLNGPLPIEVGQLNMLGFMDISENELSGTIPVSIGDCSSLLGLNIARNRFEGLIPESFGRLGSLESLDLSFNNLSGQIPIGLEKLRFLQNLNLSFNNLQAKVPVEGVFRIIGWESLQGNKGLCGDTKDTQKKLRLPACSKNGSSSLKLKIAVPIASSVALLCVLFSLISIANSKKRKSNIEGSSWRASFKGRRRKISYEDILSATNNFDSRNLIGKGGFSSVYKGIISGENGKSTTVAIKVLDLNKRKASKSFASECETLRNIRHRNLVKIITSCSSIDHSRAEFKALVMDFMSNGSLEEWLHPGESATMMRLNLLQRLNISIDVAAAMDYLHHDCDPPVAHCDLKPGNVLLDDEMIAHVGDFGLARCLFPSEKHSSTIELKGSVGYIAPEYGLGSKASMSGDVYSYGILLLEILTGKKPTDDMFKDGLNLNKFAAAVFENRVAEIVDPGMLEDDDDFERSNSTSRNTYTNSNISNDSISGGSHGNINNETGLNWQSRKEECLEDLIRIGLSCAAYTPKVRPKMREILVEMHHIKESLFQLGGN
ncbi:probable LRR receptor-like serine/threonine-protein kinase At3g47570 [Magnolia sinica]|uniref:probable LRR receptor-like serine/threonine-protein kinase At3g47570 n=1 Tax=Magnolia sinica TaxID=86752 RepID=UPI00265B360A|nr:probable LRR receptor-like serine/threonine-protein kinase At3g47570 [Magnolia sinica]